MEPAPKNPRPRRCPDCPSGTLLRATVEDVSQIRHENTLHTIRIIDLPVLRCDTCGEIYYTNDSQARTSRALREHLGLLHPEQIAAGRAELGLTQRQLAEAIGVAPESLSRWETGAMIQSRSTDRLLRGYFGSPEFRRLLSRLSA